MEDVSFKFLLVYFVEPISLQSMHRQFLELVVSLVSSKQVHLNIFWRLKSTS
jgi:hypothetical protein